MFMGISENRNVPRDVVQMLRYRGVIATISVLICLVFVACGGSSVEDGVEATAWLSEGMESSIIDGEISSSSSPPIDMPVSLVESCGNSCAASWMVGNRIITIGVSECEEGDPRVGATIPFKPDYDHKVMLDDLMEDLNTAKSELNTTK